LPIYSKRLPSGLTQNKHSLVLSEQRRQGRPLLDLTISNPTECFENYPHAAIKAALSEARDYRYQPDPLGDLAAREAICDYYRARGVALSPKQLILTVSSSEAYSYLFKLLCDPQDEVLIPIPSYPLFTYLGALESVTAIPYQLRYDGSWYLDFNSLRAAISPGTKAIVTVNPNNPTGTLLSIAERDELLAIAADHDLAVISDEVFADYNLGPERSTSLIGNNSALSFVLNGLSKAAGMPQMKLGWIALNGAPKEIDRALERLEVIADTYLSVGTPVAKALPQLLAIGAVVKDQILHRVRSNLALLDRRLANSAAHRLHLDGGWSAIVQVPETQSEEDWVTRLIEEHAVITQPGYFFDMGRGAYVVLSLITPPETFEEGTERLSAYVGNHS
jgi:aspartate/methionine/tyrosine aminotransferase